MASLLLSATLIRSRESVRLSILSETVGTAPTSSEAGAADAPGSSGSEHAPFSRVLGADASPHFVQQSFYVGRPWFAPALEQKTHRVGHSGTAAVLQGVAGKPARLLVQPGATVGRVGELVRRAQVFLKIMPAADGLHPNPSMCELGSMLSALWRQCWEDLFPDGGDGGFWKGGRRGMPYGVGRLDVAIIGENGAKAAAATLKLVLAADAAQQAVCASSDQNVFYTRETFMPTKAGREAMIAYMEEMRTMYENIAAGPLLNAEGQVEVLKKVGVKKPTFRCMLALVFRG
ncbi:hypothetical protein AK812_SmicGene17622 [Symbiodinium microadriaticum]|uniref:Uncharacterized protein n=1 Tax=Symbiodinium microadriaticum TaxID=2951 RepID=A0A1Q9DX89_SYMMI|nr:hypothetical protein AK812_SmicGene17622 [Symbiodinium microadriaticum]